CIRKRVSRVRIPLPPPLTPVILKSVGGSDRRGTNFGLGIQGYFAISLARARLSFSASNLGVRSKVFAQASCSLF
ncbi:MAG: hypothetical protein VW684_11080, partial [Betaproteobacteria bacterium]